MNYNKGEYIYKARVAANMTMEELGEKIGVSKSTIKKYENGTVKNIPSDKIEAIAAATGVSCGFLMGWDQLKEENASLHARILKDETLQEAIKEYYNLDKTERELVRNMILSLSNKKKD